MKVCGVFVLLLFSAPVFAGRSYFFHPIHQVENAKCLATLAEVHSSVEFAKLGVENHNSAYASKLVVMNRWEGLSITAPSKTRPGGHDERKVVVLDATSTGQPKNLIHRLSVAGEYELQLPNELEVAQLLQSDTLWNSLTRYRIGNREFALVWMAAPNGNIVDRPGIIHADVIEFSKGETYSVMRFTPFMSFGVLKAETQVFQPDLQDYVGEFLGVMKRSGIRPFYILSNEHDPYAFRKTY